MTNQKINYQKQLEEILKKIEKERTVNSNSNKPTLLLHACCGPCSSYVIEYLAQIFDITIFYYNPNIHPRNEYIRRLEELKKFLACFPEATKNSVKLVIDEYNPEDYYKATNVRSEINLQTEPEKGERCRRCYKFRMEKAYKYACEHNYNWFTTTLSISPHKDSEKINTIGYDLEHMNFSKIALEKHLTNDSLNIISCTKFLPADFKKKGGFLRSTQLSDEYGLWRQDYCGCVFSMRDSTSERVNGVFSS
ncbi:epoxyqueuosine reductase QueH [Treponema sp.]|uniref:epoxyqueuosine reductase QueH n=1 Tax=Treponema sp. TaxID=166 RepID=UPI003890B09C